MPNVIPAVLTTVWLLQEVPSIIAIPLVILAVFLVIGLVILVVKSFVASSNGGGSVSSGSKSGGARKGSISSYSRSFEKTRSSSRARMRSASDAHLHKVRDTLRR